MTNEQKLVEGVRKGIIALANMPGVLDEALLTAGIKKLTEQAKDKNKQLLETKYRAALTAGYRGSYEDFIEIPEKG